jgi:hypothetical protein
VAIFDITEGPPGQGKSLDAGRIARKLLVRNRKWHEKGNPVRKIYSNIKWSNEFERELGIFGEYWSDLRELCELRDVDIIWDEIANELDARNWTNLTNEVKRMLSQHRKRGLDIYGNTQDYEMVDKRARLMFTRVERLTKLIGSRDTSATKPKIRHVWGVIIKRSLENFRSATSMDDRKYSPIPTDIFFIERALIDIYDTTQDIPIGKPPPLQHMEKICEKHGKGCDFRKVFHD